MNYELVNVLRPETDNWKKQSDRAFNNKSTLITLAPDPFLEKKRRDNYHNIINVVDFVTKRSANYQGSLFFDKVPTVAGAEIFMNIDGVITLVKDGDTIGVMRTFPNTRRLVQDVTYFNVDQTRDVTEEYTFTGQLYSNIFYYKNEIQEIAFFDDNQNVRLRFHFYLGSINFITVENPITHEVEEKYGSLAEFQAAQIAKIVNKNDTVGITYLGLELDALAKTKSENTLYLEESAFEGDNLKGNLQLIIENRIPYIQKVIVNREDYEKMVALKVDISKVSSV